MKYKRGDIVFYKYSNCFGMFKAADKETWTVYWYDIGSISSSRYLINKDMVLISNIFRGEV